MPEIQERRAKLRVPGGRPLHEYANLYFNARNPMMYKRRDEHEVLCVLRIGVSVLDLPGVIITDQNAAKAYVRFSSSPAGLALIDRDQIFAEFWLHRDDANEESRHKARMCTEVLVPDRVPASYIFGAYVSSERGATTLRVQVPELPLEVRPYVFFQKGAING